MLNWFCTYLSNVTATMSDVDVNTGNIHLRVSDWQSDNTGNIHLRASDWLSDNTGNIHLRACDWLSDSVCVCVCVYRIEIGW